MRGACRVICWVADAIGTDMDAWLTPAPVAEGAVACGTNQLPRGGSPGRGLRGHGWPPPLDRANRFFPLSSTPRACSEHGTESPEGSAYLLDARHQHTPIDWIQEARPRYPAARPWVVPRALDDVLKRRARRVDSARPSASRMRVCLAAGYLATNTSDRGRLRPSGRNGAGALVRSAAGTGASSKRDQRRPDHHDRTERQHQQEREVGGWEVVVSGARRLPCGIQPRGATALSGRRRDSLLRTGT